MHVQDLAPCSLMGEAIPQTVTKALSEGLEHSRQFVLDRGDFAVLEIQTHCNAYSIQAAKMADLDNGAVTESEVQFQAPYYSGSLVAVALQRKWVSPHL